MNKPIKELTLGEVQEECLKHGSCAGCKLYRGVNAGNLCSVKEFPDRWNINDDPRFTQEEVDLAKAIRALYPDAYILNRGTKSIAVRDSNEVFLCVISSEKFNSIQDGCDAMIDDILACGGT